MAKTPQIGIRASPNMWRKPITSVPADDAYSQPVLYAHFGSREGVLAAVAIEGFQEIGLALEKARKRPKRGNTVESVAAAYLEFAASSPALYEVNVFAQPERTIR